MPIARASGSASSATGDPRFLVSFLDDNAFGREEDRSFWTRGESRADIVFKANRPIRRADLQGGGWSGAGST